jgi:bifunctional non-homologous end joining protein LigD
VVTGRGARLRHAAPPSVEPLLLNLPAPSPIPGRIRSEAAVPCVEAFDHPDWRFSVDWDGSRALLFASPGSVRLQNEALTDVTGDFPEIVSRAARFAERELVLDGVIGVLDPEGRPDLASLGKRMVGAAASATLPAVYLATDLIYMGGRPLITWPLDKRLAALREAVDGDDPIQVPDLVEARGRALGEAAAARGLAGLLARRGDAPYRPGVASPDRLRIALTDRTTCVVVALTNAAAGKSRGLLLAEREKGRLVVAGWVAAPADRAVSAWLDERAGSLGATSPPLDAPEQGGSVRWLRPSITATVTHSGRHRDGTLRAPSLVALRDDCDPMWCVRREPTLPPDIDVALRGFVPTLLLPLPLDQAALVPHRSR